MKLQKKKSNHNKFSKALGFPEGTSSKSFYIQLYSNNSINIEGNCTVLNFNEQKISVNTPECIVNICGENLAIDEFAEQSLNITGSINSVTFC